MTHHLHSKPEKVIWSEGILLGQQHFQQWERYFEYQWQWRWQYGFPMAWGIAEIVVDESALLNHQFSLHYCEAIFPRGVLVQFDAKKDGGLYCKLDVSAAKENVAIYLCLPDGQQITGMTGYQNPLQQSTWIAHYQETQDHYDSNRSREVLYGKMNLQLLREEELHGGLHYLKIADLFFDGKRYQINSTFIPAALQIKNSDLLQNKIYQWVDKLVTHIMLINERKQMIVSDEQDHSFSRLHHILLLQILNRYIGQLKLSQQNLEFHPWYLYSVIFQLCVELSLFSQEYQLQNLKNYCHDDLSNTFKTLENQFDLLLQQALPAMNQSLKLQKINNTLYSLENIDSQYFSAAHFFLGVYFVTDEIQWIALFSRQVKIGEIKALNSIIASALTGVKVTHVQRPPSKLSIKTGYEYFRLEPQGEYWQQIKNAGNLSIFLPHNFANATIEIIVLQE